jgi:hypothetical protein
MQRMSTVQGNVVIAIKAVDEASGVFGQLSSALTGALSQLGPLGQQLSSVITGFATAGPMGAAVAGIGALAVSLKGCFEAAVSAEDVWNRLKGTVERSGEAWSGVEEQIHNATEALMGVSRFDDEQMAAALKTLMDFGMKLPEALKTLNSVMDLATAKQVDLSIAAQTVGKAFQGNTGLLERMGVVVSESKDVAVKFSETMENVQKQFGGAAQADLSTYAGKMAQLQIKMAELGEKIGNALLPVLLPLVDGFIAIIDTLTDFAAGIKGAIDWLEKLWNAMTAGANEAVKGMKDSVMGAGEYVTDAFKGVYKTLVGGSIWPDMWKEMIKETVASMDEISATIGVAVVEIARLLEDQSPDLSNMLDPLLTAKVTLEQMNDVFGDLVDSSGSIGEGLDKLQAGLDSGSISVNELQRGFIELSTKISTSQGDTSRFTEPISRCLEDMLDPLISANVTVQQMHSAFGVLVEDSTSLGEALNMLRNKFDSGEASLRTLNEGFAKLSVEVGVLGAPAVGSPVAAVVAPSPSTVYVNVYSSVGTLAIGNKSELDDYLKQVYRTVVDAVRAQ